MTGREKRPQAPRYTDLPGAAISEIRGMAAEGMAHPATRPALTGAAVGAVAGMLLPIVTLPAGVLAGAGFMLYKRLRS